MKQHHFDAHIAPTELATLRRLTSHFECELTTLYTHCNLMAALHKTTTLADTLNLALETLSRLGGMDCGGIYLVYEQSHDLDLVVHQGLSRSFVQQHWYYDAASPLAGLIRQGQPVYRRRTDLQPPLTHLCADDQVGALAVIPIAYQQRVVAALFLASHACEERSISMRAVLNAAAAQLGTCIACAQLELKLQNMTNLLQDVLGTQETGDSLLVYPGIAELPSVI